MAKNPCYKCTKRYDGCHSVCKEYKDFVDDNERRKEQIRKEKHYDNDFNVLRKKCIVKKK